MKIKSSVLPPRVSGIDYYALLSPALAILFAVIPLFINPRFYFIDDSQSSAFGQYYHIGQRILRWDWSLINPTVWQSGNYIAETSWGIFSPLLWVIGLCAVMTTNIVFFLTVLKVGFLALAAYAAYKLALTFGMKSAWAVVVAVVATSNGVTRYLDAPSWANGLMGWALFLLAWWALRRAIHFRGSLILAALTGLLLIGINYVHATLFYCVVLLLTGIESIFARDREKIIRSLGLGFTGLFAVIVVNLPLILIAPATARNTGIQNSGTMTLDVSNLIASMTSYGSPYINFFGWYFPNAPIIYTAWLLPMGAFIFWGGFIRTLKFQVALLGTLLFGLLILLGPSDLGPLRFPIRVLPYVEVTVLICLGMGLSLFRISTLPVRRLVAALAIIGVSVYFSLSASPNAEKVVLVGSLGSAAGIFVYWKVLRQNSSRVLFATVSIIIVTFILGTFQVAVSPRSPLREYELPGNTSAYQNQLAGVRGEALMVGDPSVNQPKIWTELLIGNMWYLNPSRLVQNAYSTIYSPAYADATCMTYNGATACPELFASLFREDPELNRTLADLMGVSAIAVVKESVPTWRNVPIPDGWKVVTNTREVFVVQRDVPVPGAGSIVWQSQGVVLDVDRVDSTGVEFTVQSVPAGGGKVAFSRLPWPGYVVDGPASLAKPTRDGLLLTVSIGRASEGEKINVHYELPGKPYILLSSIALLFLLLLGIPLLEFTRRDRGPKWLRRLIWRRDEEKTQEGKV